jgi:hypothetical protein
VLKVREKMRMKRTVTSVIMLLRTGRAVIDWIDLAQDRDTWVLVNVVMNLQVPYISATLLAS